MKLKPRDLFWMLLRRGMQLSVFAFLVIAAGGGIWRNYKVAHNSSRLVRLMEGELMGDLYLLGERFFGVFGESYRASYDFLGAPWSGTIMGVTTADPILVMSNTVSTGSFHWALLPALLVTCLIASVLGKVFCSHLCPMRLLFELGQLIRGGVLRMGLVLPHYQSSARFGGWILLGGMLASMSAGMAVWFLALPYLSLSGAIILAVTTGAASALVAFPLGWLIVDVLFAPGYFCHNVCPQGFLLEQVGRFSLLKVHKTSDGCPKNCRVCSLTCPYGLNPRERTHTPACDNCGACVRACPERKLKRRFSLPVITAAMLLFTPNFALAHHNKGLPHYGYYENYPQVPTEENIVVDGRWEIGATIFNFQGLDRTLADTPNDVKLFVYVYDLELDKPYTGAIDFDIVLDGVVVSTFSRESIDEELIYSTRETMPQSGNYELVAHLRDIDDSEQVALDFNIDLNDGSVSWWIIGGLLGPLIPLFVLAAAGRTRRGKAMLLKSNAAANPKEQMS